MRSAVKDVASHVACYHCGQPCEEVHQKDDKTFCCFGCQTVYQILNENDLCEYYSLDDNPGTRQNDPDLSSFAYLDEPAIRKKIVSFESPEFSRLTFFIPQIHCISCIWLLENIHRLADGVIHAEVNFARKELTLDYNPRKISLSRVAGVLSSIGYAPAISLARQAQETTVPTRNNLVLRLSVAGFCFGNVMLLSFPEYLGIDAQSDHQLVTIFSYLNLTLSVPVLLFSGAGYIQSAWKSFAQRQINIDVPIAVGLVVLFGRSAWDILSQSGPGYLDSFTGLVFFLLVGRWFQDKTYESLAFDRDFKSYFPLAVHRWTDQEWRPVIIHQLGLNDRIRIRNMEIIPADSILDSPSAFIDYSFVTGEARPVKLNRGDLVYAGGRLVGSPVELIVHKITSQSHLTSLWNHHIFRKNDESRYRRLTDSVARAFTWAVLALSVVTAIYWYTKDQDQMWLVITAVLMVACPCALALAAPFTYGSMVRSFGHFGFYLKNADVIERLAKTDAVVFDKTGTLTQGTSSAVTFHGHLSERERSYVYTLAASSTHPLSVAIAKRLKYAGEVPIGMVREFSGQGIEGIFENNRVRIGSPTFTSSEGMVNGTDSVVAVSINDRPRGYFAVGVNERTGIRNLITRMKSTCAGLLSGDHDTDRKRMQRIFGDQIPLLFNQSPHQKLAFIEKLQQEGKHVTMVGDGLNDAGALKQSDVGIAVTEDTGVFSPACDAILHGDRIGCLDTFIALSRSATTIVKAGFIISFCYNAIALSFAVSGLLTPLIAAILMPLSSISVVGFSTLAVNFVVSRTKLKRKC